VVGVALRGDERQYNTLNTVTKTVPHHIPLPVVEILFNAMTAEIGTVRITIQATRRSSRDQSLPDISALLPRGALPLAGTGWGDRHTVIRLGAELPLTDSFCLSQGGSMIGL
jgi:hypothetical protein